MRAEQGFDVRNGVGERVDTTCGSNPSWGVQRTYVRGSLRPPAEPMTCTRIRAQMPSTHARGTDCILIDTASGAARDMTTTLQRHPVSSNTTQKGL
ncbi:hypothetical protein D8W71_17230 [Rhodococcus sp. P1Y]|nr:hypothetical protein D8W71_17230 [Rhodococcus sp. P1Y]